MQIEVARVDPGVGHHDELGELDVVVAQRLGGAIDLFDDEIDAFQRELLEASQLLVKA